ncbi:hypothetical protein NC651_039022 [Populus alba x Populus x berolinensis]|nr:hypothetical protein NC651_039022 [Populus alba x Populus x berolinensis]
MQMNVYFNLKLLCFGGSRFGGGILAWHMLLGLKILICVLSWSTHRDIDRTDYFVRLQLGQKEQKHVESCKIQPMKAYTKVPDPMNVIIVLWPGHAQKLQSLAFGVWTRPPFLGCIKAENCPLPSYRTHGYKVITGSMIVISIYCLLYLMVATSHHILYEFAKTKDNLFQYSWSVGIVSLSETIH